MEDIGFGRKERKTNTNRERNILNTPLLLETHMTTTRADG